MTSYYNADGKECTEKDAVCCVTKLDDNSYNYYIKAYGPRVYDKYNLSYNDNRVEWRMVKVSKDAFDHYFMFLKTMSQRQKLLAERLL